MKCIAKRIAIILICLPCCALLPGGCALTPSADPDSLGIDMTLPADTRVDGAVIFLIDGMNSAIFDEMLQAGQLPAMKRYFVDRGIYSPRTASNIPSVTLPNLTSVVTSQFPGHHGITGINWFDRNRLIWRDYATVAQKNMLDSDHTSATLFEQFPQRTTFSVFYQAHRGASKFIENRLSGGPIYGFGWYQWLDRLTLSRLSIVADVARKQKCWPAIVVCYLLSPDFVAYGNGTSMRAYRDALKHSDMLVGKALGDMQRAGLLDKLVIAVVSDHGHADVKRHFLIEDHLRDKFGLGIAKRHLWEDTPFELRMEYYRKYSAVAYGSGERYFALSLRKPLNVGDQGFAPWAIRPAIKDLRHYPLSPKRRMFGVPESGRAADLLEYITKLEAVDVVACRSGAKTVLVKTKAGEIEFKQAAPGEAISCRIVTGTDPLAWGGKVPESALIGAPMSPRWWLGATHNTKYPDLPAQILAYFRSRYAGDIAVFAVPGWDFTGEHHGGHGGLRSQDMLTPMLIAGPGVPHKRVETARTVDLMPTVLKLLSRPVPPGLDGESLVAPTVQK